MSAAILQNPIFTDNDKAREWLEAQSLGNWPRLPALRRRPAIRPFSRAKRTATACTSATTAASNLPSRSERF